MGMFRYLAAATAVWALSELVMISEAVKTGHKAANDGGVRLS